VSVKFGSRPKESEKGKAGVVDPSKDKLPNVIDTPVAEAGRWTSCLRRRRKANAVGNPERRLNHQSSINTGTRTAAPRAFRTACSDHRVFCSVQGIIPLFLHGFLANRGPEINRVMPAAKHRCQRNDILNV
jgi:hypothetical protein